MTDKKEAQRISEEAEKLADQAKDAGLDVIAYLLTLAALEGAETAIRRDVLKPCVPEPRAV